MRYAWFYWQSTIYPDEAMTVAGTSIGFPVGKVIQPALRAQFC